MSVDATAQPCLKAVGQSGQGHSDSSKKERNILFPQCKKSGNNFGTAEDRVVISGIVFGDGGSNGVITVFFVTHPEIHAFAGVLP